MKPAASTTKNHVIVLFIIIYATMLLFGLVENVKGVSFPLIKAEFGVDYDSQGGLVSLTWMGYVIFCLAASLFLQHFGIKKSILMGYILVGIGAVATLMAPSFWMAAMTLLIVNAGFGFFEVGANALASVVFTSRAALMMNLMHFFYGFGAIAGPQTAGVLTGTFGLEWRQVYLAVLVPVGLVFLFIVFTRFQGKAGHESASSSSSVTFISALKQPVVWLFCLTLGFMEVIEFGAANWGGLYLQDVHGMDPRVVGAAFVSLFYILFTTARLIGGWFIEHVGYVRSLSVALTGTILVFLVGFGLGLNGIWVLPFTGLFIGIMWPTLMAFAMQVFGDDAPIVTSVIITVSGAVNGIFQLLIGLTNYFAGEAWGYRSCLLYSVLVLILLNLLASKVQSLPNKTGLEAVPGA